MNKFIENEKREIFPIGLLISGRPCLVVGGGRVGLRKVHLLLNAGAEVTVVSPELHPELAELVPNRITYVSRKFASADVANFFLIFAATSDRSVNEAVLKSCREHRAYGCSADSNWPLGDFVTPATLRRDGVTIAVSTGGKSCRRSRMIKDSLHRHLQMVENADLMVLGTSHACLSIQKREPYHLVGDRLQQVGKTLMQIWGVHEFAILNTCNRIELIAVVSNLEEVEIILKLVLGFNSLDSEEFYLKRGFAAFAHLSMLTAGLCSQVPGEKHIVAQVKQAVSAATEQGWAGAIIQQWHDAALHVGKHIRQATEQFLQPTEIENLVPLYLNREFGSCPDSRLLIIGTGTVGRGLSFMVASHGKNVLWCYHRQRPEVPEKYRGLMDLCKIEELPEKLKQVDVIICATGSDGYVLSANHAPYFDTISETLIIDLGMPRNAAPQLKEKVDAIKLVDLDDLKHWYNRRQAALTPIDEISDDIIADHEHMYAKLINGFQPLNRHEKN